MRSTAITDEVRSAVDRALELARATPGLDGYEVRADVRDDRRYALRDGAPSGTRVTRSRGLGINIYAGGGSAYTHTADFSSASMREAIERGRSLAVANGQRAWERFDCAIGRTHRSIYVPDVEGPPSEIASSDEVMALLARVEQGARERSEGLNVQSGFGAFTTWTLFADSAGSWTERGSLVSTLIAVVAAREAGRMGSGIARRGGELGLGDLSAGQQAEDIGAESARRAQESVRAQPMPAGRYRVLCDPELAGTLAHESFGHLTEYDLVSSGWSRLQGRRGDRLAHEQVSISDSPVIAGGKQGVVVPFDDEGTPGRAVRLLDRGVLSSWMHTRDSATSMEDQPAGNGRALNAKHPPIVRMRNTYFEPGDHSLEEALERLGDGLYLIGAHGGAPHSDGSFMFTAARGYRVEKGELVAPVRTTAIHGNVLDFLQNVEALTRDIEVTTNYYGGCGKREQSFLHVGVGGPHVLVNGALVGGSG